MKAAKNRLSDSCNGTLQTEKHGDVSPGTGAVFNRTRSDLLVLLVLALMVMAVALLSDTLEQMMAFVTRFTGVNVAELAAVLMVTSLVFLVFSYRRIVDINIEQAKRTQIEVTIDHLAMHDPMTGLPNRILAKSRLQTELSRALREGSQVVVHAIDIDRFKQINEVLGHEAGEDLLKIFSRRISDTIRDMDTLARLGADKFVLLQPCVHGSQAAVSMAKRLLAVMDDTLHINGQELKVSISVGIVLSSASNSNAAELLRNADIALNRAQVAGGARYCFYETEMDKHLQDKRLMEEDLREAIRLNMLSLYYQPLFDVNSRRLLGFEALLRWNHAQRGFVSPSEFIPLAEETGLIIGLGDWVLERAMQDAMSWEGEGKIAVNLSPVQFRDKTLPEKVATLIERTGFPPHRLELEITEGVLIEDADVALGMLLELKALGVRISMDDFGTGYSSLSYLKMFPFDKIKIDRSFVSHLEFNSEDAAIVKAILAMGHSLGMIATAEGVESAEQLNYLFAEGCDEAQGFLLGRPMPFEHALALSRSSLAEVPVLAEPAIAANDYNYAKHSQPKI